MSSSKSINRDELNWWACSTLSNVLQSAALRLLLLSKPCFWRESMRGARINVGGPTGGLWINPRDGVGKWEVGTTNWLQRINMISTLVFFCHDPLCSGTVGVINGLPFTPPSKKNALSLKRLEKTKWAPATAASADDYLVSLFVLPSLHALFPTNLVGG